MPAAGSPERPWIVDLTPGCIVLVVVRDRRRGTRPSHSWPGVHSAALSLHPVTSETFVEDSASGAA
jgi:hypothetical protein